MRLSLLIISACTVFSPGVALAQSWAGRGTTKNTSLEALDLRLAEIERFVTDAAPWVERVLGKDCNASILEYAEGMSASGELRCKRYIPPPPPQPPTVAGKDELSPSRCTADPVLCRAYGENLGRSPDAGGATWWYETIVAPMRRNGASDRTIRQMLDREMANDYEVIEYRGGVADADAKAEEIRDQEQTQSRFEDHFRDDALDRCTTGTDCGDYEDEPEWMR